MTNFISWNESKKRENIINKICNKFFNNTNLNDDNLKKIAELSGVYKVKINNNTKLVETYYWSNGIIDSNNIKQPQISEEELNNPDIKSLADLYSFRAAFF